MIAEILLLLAAPILLVFCIARVAFCGAYIVFIVLRGLGCWLLTRFRERRRAHGGRRWLFVG